MQETLLEPFKVEISKGLSDGSCCTKLRPSDPSKLLPNVQKYCPRHRLLSQYSRKAFAKYCMDGKEQNFIYFDDYGGALLGTEDTEKMLSTNLKSQLDLTADNVKFGEEDARNLRDHKITYECIPQGLELVV